MKGAFDMLSQLAIQDFIVQCDVDFILQRLLWSVYSEHYFRIRLGQYVFNVFTSNRGVIQGGFKSPRLFVKVLDMAFEDWDNKMNF